MPFTLYRIEKDGTETIIGTAHDAGEASLMIDADKDSIDWEAGYHWVHEDDKQIKIANGNWRQLYMNLWGITTRRKQKLVMRWYKRLSKFNRKHNCGCDNRQILYFAIVKVSLGKNILYNYVFERN